MDNETKLYYDLTAERTADEWYANNVLVPTIQDFVSLLPARPKVLDLGCGPGYESMRLAAAGADVIGVDWSCESIRIARERCPQCQFAELDFRQLDSRFGMFDGVFASASLIHIAPAELPDVLLNVADVLRAGGKLMAIVQDGEGIRERWPEVAGHSLHRVIYLYSQQALERCSRRFRFLREGYLAPELAEHGWRCYLFEVVKGQD